MSARYLLLHRAIRNSGDSLIFERARRLIAAVHPDATLESAAAWRPLGDQLSKAELAAIDAVVVCGGPGYAPGLAARYPIGELTDLPPLVLLALGSFVVPGTDAQLLGPWLGDDDRRFLERVLTRSPWLGARDPLTADLLRSIGFERILMTGDPAWYDLERLADPIRVSATPHAIAVTPPANPAFFRQAIDLFSALAQAYAGSRFTVVYHRGVQRPFARLADQHGWSELDITGDAHGFGVYDRSDLHLGYRVHAHLYSLSVATPSYLLAEDSRGLGMLRGLASLGRPAFDTDQGGAGLELLMRHLPRVANAHRPATSWLGPLVGRVLRMPDVSAEIVTRIKRDAAAGFPDHEVARATVRATLPTMRRMIESLP